MTWKLLDPRVRAADLGLLPYIIDADDPRPVAEQVQDKYAHGGGWSPYGAGDWKMDAEGHLKYPGDTKMKPLAMTVVRGETVRMHEYGIVSVQQPDGSFEVVRMD